jgi:cytochrome-b5 reductase
MIVVVAGILALVVICSLIAYLSRSRSFLQPDAFKPATLIEKDTITHNTKRFRFALPPGVKLGLPIGQHISLSYTDGDGKTVMRSYTPVTGNETMGYVDFVIKVYPQGKMSQHVDQLKISESIVMRGPKGTFKYTPNMKRAFGVSSHAQNSNSSRWDAQLS